MQVQNSVKATRHLFRDFYMLCMDVKKKLKYDEDIDFYIIQDPMPNAFAFRSIAKDKAHIINIHSGLLNLLNDEEKKFVIGHEIGHLINKDHQICGGVNFVFPDDKAMPLFIKRRVDMYNVVAELSADRYGYLACDSLEAAVSTMYKLNCGLDMQSYHVMLEDMLDESEDQLRFLLDEGVATHTTHPFQPIRVKALELFANARTDEMLEAEMLKLINMLHEFGGSEVDKYMMDFIVTAGIKMAEADGESTKEEQDKILEKLGEIMIQPKPYFDKIRTAKDFAKIHNDAVRNLRKMGKQSEMVHFLIDIALADGRLDNEEIKRIIDFGRKIDVPDEMIVEALGVKIQQNYRPLAINLYDLELINERKIKSESFVMNVTSKCLTRNRSLVLCGQVKSGIIKSNDKVLLTNGTKEFGDEVKIIVVGSTIIDSTEGYKIDNDLQLYMTVTDEKCIDGSITDWVVKTI